jgi:hypothetical protein
MDIRVFCYLASLLLATNTALASDIKKWIDDDGQVHFGDLAPQGANSVEINPEVITTTPPSHDGLGEIMRPGELRMLERYEQRNKRLTKAKREAANQAKLKTEQITSDKKRCDYNRQQKQQLKRKLRAGVSRSLKNRIEEKLSKHNRQIKEYCN